MNLKLSDFDYNLPEELIAQHPVKPRDHSRLLVMLAKTKLMFHQHFYNCIDYMEAGDVLVVNDSKVIPARLFGKKETGGKVEIFLLRELQFNEWECLLGGARIKPGTTILLDANFKATIITPLTENTWRVKFNKDNITSIGTVPLPPYIKAKNDMADYQTVYADSDGSVAAPTAGLHFTQELLKSIKRKGIIIKHITLHVGLGTFAPVVEDDISKHIMHKEFATLPDDTAEALKVAKQNNNRIIAVGTTSIRTLEAFHGEAKSNWVDLFINPGYAFNTVNGLITNFHLPKTTLLMLVAAFTGKDFMDQAYQEAIKEKYRFYSFGDAMFILR